MAFALRGYQSKKHLIVTAEGALHHADEWEVQEGSRGRMLFILVPGHDHQSGRVTIEALDGRRVVSKQHENLRMHWAADDEGSFEDQFWHVETDSNRPGAFAFRNAHSTWRLYSHSEDGDDRMSHWHAMDVDDQFFIFEGQVLVAKHGRRLFYGIQDSGFCVGDSTVYTDVWQQKYIVNRRGELELQRSWSKNEPKEKRWGSASELRWQSMKEREDPHQFLIRRVPLLFALQQMGLINHARSTVWHDRKAGRPGNAVKFALWPVSNGRRVEFKAGWKEAWHGANLPAIRRIAAQGLKLVGGKIFATPSWQYAFNLYSVDILIQDAPQSHERIRLVLQLRVADGAYIAHGDPYDFFKQEDVEGRIPREQMEWELNGRDAAEQVQVVGIVAKQVRFDHPFVLHGTLQNHMRTSLLHEWRL